MRILLRGPFNPYTGYGNDLIGLALALGRRSDVKIVPMPVSIMPPLPKDVAMMFTEDPSGKYDVALEHMPPFDLAPPKNVRAVSDKVVGWTMWEQSEFRRDHMKGHGQGRAPWKKLDHIVCYDHVSKAALDVYDPDVPKSVLQGGVEADFWPYHERDWSDTFRFAMLGELHMRKDPFVAIEAFRELREEGLLPDAELHLKTSIAGGLHPAIEDWVPGIKIHSAMWSRERVREFICSTHCLLAPSRGEGKNLPALEIMLTGGVVIATNWGGHQVWMHPDYAFSLDYELHPIGPGETSMNARASKEHLKQLMVKAYENRAECRRMGQVASQVIRQTHDWSVVADRMLRIIRSL